jgi:CubicO group peptidase (beta-lactamase class C family)
MRTRLRLPIILFVFIATCSAQQLTPDLKSKIDDTAHQVLTATGVPSASIAVVKDGQVVYAQAYGDARVEPKLAASTGMRYGVGSISKQFTAAAILLLQEQGKLKLDDPVGKYLPDLTRANEVTIRQLLSHTSGYQDYWPQDYLMPFIMKPTTPEKIMDTWARKPLDFDPGTKWQYSNTNFTIAGAIVEKVSGKPILQFLTDNIFRPLGMHSVIDIDETHPTETDAVGYLRYALGPPRVAPLEGKGWMFAAGELYMTPADLAKWNISMINQTVLKPASYKEMQTEVKLKNGEGTHYGLGVSLFNEQGHRVVEHSGEVSGFVAENIVLPDDKIAITVLTNQDASSAASQIGERITSFLLPSQPGAASSNADLDRARKVFEGLQQGKIDRSQFTDDANFYFTEQALQDFASSLGPLGAIQEFTASRTSLRGGMTYRGYRAKVGGKQLSISIYEMPDGKYEQYLVEPRE